MLRSRTRADRSLRSAARLAGPARARAEDASWHQPVRGDAEFRETRALQGREVPAVEAGIRMAQAPWVLQCFGLRRTQVERESSEIETPDAACESVINARDQCSCHAAGAYVRLVVTCLRCDGVPVQGSLVAGPRRPEIHCRGPDRCIGRVDAGVVAIRASSNAATGIPAG